MGALDVLDGMGARAKKLADDYNKEQAEKLRRKKLGL
jgi:hypothetical protein